MDLLIDVGLPFALIVIMFSLGLGLTVGDFLRVAQRPKAFGIGAFNQIIMLPLIALGVISVFGLKGEIAVGLMLLAACPGGVTSNVIAKIARADVALSVSLTAVISLISAITVPLLLAWSTNRFLGENPIVVDVTGIALTMFALTVVPVTLGLALRHFKTELTLRAEPLISRISVVLFVVIVAAALASNWGLFLENVVVLGPALVTLLVILLCLGLLVPKLLGFPSRVAKTISIETAIQNPTLGIAVAGILAADAPGLGAFALPSATYGILMYVITLPAVALFRKQASSSDR